MQIIQIAMARARQEGDGAPAASERKGAQDSAADPRQKTGTARTAVQFPDEAVLERNRILTALNDQSFSDAYSLLRTRILEVTRSQRWNTIMITSPGPGEGKTTTAINLGISIARDTQHTALVVDTNLRRPGVQPFLQLDAEKGLTDYLLDGVPVQRLLIKPGVDKFVVLPGGRPLLASTEVLGSPRMQELVRELKERYSDRYVLFDCPHLLRMPDALVFSKYVDGVVLVVRSNKTSRADIQASLDQLEGRNLIGVVMNSVQW
jgi:exopolysaccharide/PEP-CTERM locus tyrosine autokinase